MILDRFLTIDALAFESQFLDHLAPVWAGLPPLARGRFLVASELVERAKAKGIEAESVDVGHWMRAIPTAPPPILEDGPIALVASAGDIKMGRRLGYRQFVFLEHGAGQSYGGRKGDKAHGSYAGGPDREDVGLYLVPNEQCAQRWHDAYPSAQVEIVGCPKLDTLPRREPGPGPVVAISFHWPVPLGISAFAGTAFGDYSPQLAPLAKRFSVIGHAHPKMDWPDKMENQYRRAGIPFVREFEDVCRQADVYVCDNSSTIFEFAATGRPVVLLNKPEWARDRGRVNYGLRFWDAAHVGVNVDKPEDLIAAVEEALRDEPERQRDREDALAFVYQPRTNGAAYAATAVMDWLASRVEVAA